MITERKLRQWRRDALKDLRRTTQPDLNCINPGIVPDLARRILILTQELLDQHLLEKIDDEVRRVDTK